MRILFFLVVIYCTANYYLYNKIISLVKLGAAADIVIAMTVLFMTIAPVLIPIYHHRGSERSVTLFSYAGYMWLALLVPFFSVGVILDLFNVTVQYSTAPESSELSSLALPAETVFSTSLIISLLINVYGYFEARHLRTERLVFNTSKLPDSVDRIRVVQISDIHLGVILGAKTLERIISKVEKENPDIIVSTGDLVDGITQHIEHLPEMLENMKAPLGKYAVLGNHEVYGGLKNAVKFTESSGFTLLRGEGVTVEGSVNIAGMDFKGGEAAGYQKEAPLKKEHEILSSLPSGLFTVLLKHRSDVEKESLGLFDIQLSGHTHGGQIFPMNLATMFMFNYHSGFTQLEKGAAIYTSRGTGTSGPPVRFLSSPEITVIDIVRK